ncbi:DUF1667 domain-containing protein [Coprothermobacteraceae bacterium]|nr:DUF1667 domain-containing protein [Coprothermobacteraceae bacterium]
MPDCIELICIVCPVGCELRVTVQGDDIVVAGNKCPKGEQYAVHEVVSPVRFVQSTVRLLGSKTERRLPVKTDKPVPKDKVLQVAAAIRRLTCRVPVHLGEVIAENIEGLEVNVVATKTVTA